MKLRISGNKATFIRRVMEAKKYPREATCYYFIPKRDFYRSKVNHTATEDQLLRIMNDYFPDVTTQAHPCQSDFSLTVFQILVDC